MTTTQIDKVVESFSSYYNPGDTFNRRSFMSKIDFKTNSFYIDTAIKKAIDLGVIRVNTPVIYKNKGRKSKGPIARVLEYVGTSSLNEVTQMLPVVEPEVKQVDLVETVKPKTEKPKEQLKLSFNNRFDQLINLANSFRMAENLVRNLAQEALLEKPTGVLLNEATKEEVLARLKEVLLKEDF